MTTRITGELRAALEEEAARTGRTLGQVAELWMEQARAGRTAVEDMLSVPGAGPVLRSMVRFSERVAAEIGDPAQDFYAREALLHGWRLLIGRLPMGRPAPETVEQMMRLRDVAKEAGNVIEALKKGAEADPESALLQKFLAPPPLPNPFNLFAPPPSGEAGRRDALDRLSAAELLALLRDSLDEGEAIDPGKVPEMRRASSRLFERLEKILAELPEEAWGAAAGASEPLLRLMEASSAEAEARARLSELRAAALDKAAALIQPTELTVR